MKRALTWLVRLLKDMGISAKVKPRSRDVKKSGPNQFKFKRFRQGLTCVFFIFAISYSIFWCLDPFHFPISSVNLIGERRYLSQEELKHVFFSELPSGFFRLKVSRLRQQLLLLPWIKQVDVRKVWPDRLVVRFEEHKPAAIWRNKGLISEAGILFYPDFSYVKKLNLPELQGPNERFSLVWKQFLEMQKIVAPLHLTITHLTLAPRGAWHLHLSNGITVVLGTNDVLIRLSRFVSAYQKQLHVLEPKIAYADLRYTSGMAIGWRSN